MNFLDRIPFLPKEQGKRELVFFFGLAASIMILGLIGGITGVLYNDIPQSDTTPTIVVTASPTTTATPFVTGAD